MIDSIEISGKGGKGGDGAIHFHREKFMPLGGPDGGKGGKGGDVYLTASRGEVDLEGFKRKKSFKADDGDMGQANDKSGKRGEDLYIKIPMGTEVYIKDNNEYIYKADMVEDGQKLLIAKGGKPGYGNAHFTSPTRRAPAMAQKGEEGENVSLKLELKVIADVSLIGFPNAGRSTLLAAITAAKPQIAPYKFTTREPVLGIVEISYNKIIMAEMPALIPGAHLGKGLGYDFLKHVKRAKLLIHMLDGLSSDPIDDMQMVNREVEFYEPDLLNKPQIVVLNKVDMPKVKEKVKQVEEEVKKLSLPFFAISAMTGEGIDTFMQGLWECLKKLEKIKKVEEEPFVVFRPHPKDKR